MAEIINRILKEWIPGTVVYTSWLEKRGVSRQLLQKYKKSGWLESMGRGVVKRKGDEVGYQGAVFALQKYAKLSVHPAARTALALLGKSQYLEMSKKRVTLFGGLDEKLPSWFLENNWGVEIDYHQTSVFPKDGFSIHHMLGSYAIAASNAIRAMVECLYLATEDEEFVECYEIMENLYDLRPDHVRKMLMECNSVKVKRLFLYMAEKAGHDWFTYLDMIGIDLGNGKRSITKGGVLDTKYSIVIPNKLMNYE